MHISLDAALQRQPLLSTVGDKLLPAFPGAAAAYSLRALNGDANNVVRVRRSGDADGNTNEQDFTAEGVALELEDWVNGKLETTLPADVDTAAAAYSLRKVRNDYTGNAVQIRRESDNVEVNVAFDSDGEVSTSSAISNVTESPDQGDTTATTLGEFLTEGGNQDATVVTWYDQSGNGNDATQLTTGDQPKIAENGSLITEGGKPTLRFDGADDTLELASTFPMADTSIFAVNKDTGGNFNSLIGGRDGSLNQRTLRTYNANNWRAVNATDGFDFYNDGKLFVNGQDGATTGFSAVSLNLVFAYDSNFSFDYDSISPNAQGRVWNGIISEVIIYPSDQSDNRFKIESNINNYYGIYTPAEDGFVETWYDQSGSGRHAKQDAVEGYQPQIVSAGSYLGEIDFDGVNDFLQTESNFDAFGANSLSFFTVFNPSDLSGNPRFLNTRVGTAGVEFIVPPDPRLYYKDSAGNGTNGNLQNASLSADTEVLYTNIVDRDTDQALEAFKNGSSLTVSNPTDLTGVGSVNSAELTIGANNAGFQPYNGKTKEIIIYSSDQSANRTAIESNIADEYGITLS